VAILEDQLTELAAIRKDDCETASGCIRWRFAGRMPEGRSSNLDFGGGESVAFYQAALMDIPA
jgi:hypothetical protein